jgi:hypothetical protein
VGSTEPFVGRVRHVVGGDSRGDRHTEEMMPEGQERQELLPLALRAVCRLHRRAPSGAEGLSRNVRYLR